jgi:hypothetical protein
MHCRIDITTYKILDGEVDLVTRSELLSVAVMPSARFTYADVHEDTQIVVLTESSSIRLDWLKWVTEVLGESAINATYTFRRAQLDEYRNPVGPLEQVNLTSQNRIAVFLTVEASEYHIQVISVFVSKLRWEHIHVHVMILIGGGGTGVRCTLFGCSRSVF